MVGEEELQQRHHLEACRVEEEPLDVGGLGGLKEPARAVDKDGGGEDREELEGVEADDAVPKEEDLRCGEMWGDVVGDVVGRCGGRCGGEMWWGDVVGRYGEITHLLRWEEGGEARRDPAESDASRVQLEAQQVEAHGGGALLQQVGIEATWQRAR